MLFYGRELCDAYVLRHGLCACVALGPCIRGDLVVGGGGARAVGEWWVGGLGGGWWGAGGQRWALVGGLWGWGGPLWCFSYVRGEP